MGVVLQNTGDHIPIHDITVQNNHCGAILGAALVYSLTFVAGVLVVDMLRTQIDLFLADFCS